MRKRKELAATGARHDHDPARLQAIVAGRLATRFGVSMPVASTLARLAGLGPEGNRESRHA